MKYTIDYLAKLVNINGGRVINDTSEHVIDFTRINVLSDSIISCVGDIDGFTNIEVKAGTIIPGNFSSIQLQSGTAIIYY